MERTAGTWRPKGMSYKNGQTGTSGTCWWIEDSAGNALPLDDRLSPCAKGNAFLLAASPTLLTACRAALLCERQRRIEDGDDQPNRVELILEAAVKAATGDATVTST